MGETDAILAEQQEGLHRLFQAGLELALQVQADAMAAEAPEDRARLATAFHRLSRGVRQTAGLQARLAAGAVRAVREAREASDRARAARVEHRKDELRAEINRRLWNEAEPDELIEDRLEVILEAEAFAPDFPGRPLETLIARIAAEMGVDLPSPLAGEGGPRSGLDEGSAGASVSARASTGGRRETPHPALRATSSRRGRRIEGDQPAWDGPIDRIRPSPPAGEGGPRSGSDEGSQDAAASSPKPAPSPGAAPPAAPLHPSD